MDKTAWFLITSAIVIPLLTALVARSATRYSARLQSAQKRRDAEIKQLSELRDALLDALTAVQSYVFYVEKELRLRHTISTDQWLERRPIYEPAVIKTQRLDALASALPYSSELRDIYRQVDVLLMATLTGSDEEGKDAWEDAMKHQPTIMTRVVEQTARELERLLRTYPVDAPNSPNQ